MSIEGLLQTLGTQCTTFAIRSGITFASTIAFRQMSRFLQSVPQQTADEIWKTRNLLETKIKIVTPSIDLIEIIAARGNTSLDSIVQLTTTIRRDINAFASKVSEFIDAREAKRGVKNDSAIILAEMKTLLSKIEDSVPLIALALTTSGANLSSSLPETVSPSRLLQASTYLTDADRKFLRFGGRKTCQVGPAFILKLYSLYSSTARMPHKGVLSEISWKEEMAKCRVVVERVGPPATITDITEYAYEMRILEDLDDGRYHEEVQEGEGTPKAVNGIIPGRSRTLPVHMVARLFFSASGRLLNIEEAHTPVLVLKLNHGLIPPREHMELLRKADREDSEEAAEENSLSARLNDPDNIEWLAFELYTDFGSDEESDDEDDDSSEVSRREVPASLTDDLAKLSVADKFSPTKKKSDEDRATLSLLEYILRLTALQTCEQAAAIDISDERIALFLRDDNGGSRYARNDGVRMDVLSTPLSWNAHDFELPGPTQSNSRRGSRASTPASSASEPKSRIAQRSHTQEKSKNANILSPWERDKVLMTEQESPLIKKAVRRRRKGANG